MQHAASCLLRAVYCRLPTVCHFEGEAERGDLVAWVIVGVGQLRLAIQQLCFGWRPLIDAWRQMDDVHAWRAARREIDDDIALAVEAAHVAHIRVVIRGDVDVVVFGPADALQMNRYSRANRTRGRRDADDARLDRERGSRKELAVVAERQSVEPAEIVGNGHGRGGAVVAAGPPPAKIR